MTDPRAVPHSSLVGELLPFLDDGRITKLAFIGGRADACGRDTLQNMLLAANTVARLDGPAASAAAAAVLIAYLDTMYAHLMLGRGGVAAGGGPGCGA